MPTLQRAGASTRNPLVVTPAEVHAAMATSPRIMAAGMAKAQRAQGIWRGLAPVFSSERSGRAKPPHGEPGDYKNSILVTFLRKGTRFWWRVGSADYKARWIEFGTKHMPKKACREKTLSQMRGI